MTEAWEKPLGNVFNYDEKLLIPGLANGNVIITVQPPRGFEKNAVKFIMIL